MSYDKPTYSTTYRTALCEVAGLEVFSAHHVQHHSYADDIQGHVATLPHQASTTAPRLQHCITDVADWCGSKRLQLNELKTELLWFGSSVALYSLTQSDMTINRKEDVIQPVSTVSDLGVHLDSELSTSSPLPWDSCTAYVHATMSQPPWSSYTGCQLKPAYNSSYGCSFICSHRQSSDIHNGSSAACTDTLVSLDTLAFGHKVGLPGTEIAPEVWRARLQGGRSQGLEQLATACPSSREQWHLQAETKNFYSVNFTTLLTQVILCKFLSYRLSDCSASL